MFKIDGGLGPKNRIWGFGGGEGGGGFLSQNMCLVIYSGNLTIQISDHLL